MLTIWQSSFAVKKFQKYKLWIFSLRYSFVILLSEKEKKRFLWWQWESNFDTCWLKRFTFNWMYSWCVNKEMLRTILKLMWYFRYRKWRESARKCREQRGFLSAIHCQSISDRGKSMLNNRKTKIRTMQTINTWDWKKYYFTLYYSMAHYQFIGFNLI